MGQDYTQAHGMDVTDNKQQDDIPRWPKCLRTDNLFVRSLHAKPMPAEYNARRLVSAFAATNVLLCKLEKE